jgi:hypothetical protein
MVGGLVVLAVIEYLTLQLQMQKTYLAEIAMILNSPHITYA